MKKYIYVTSEGHARFEVNLYDDDIPAPVENLTPVLVEASPPLATDDFSEYHLPTARWVDVRTLAMVKTTAKERINTGRMLANMRSFTYGGKSIACDALSRSDIDGVNGYVALYSTLPPNWPGGWKTKDNSYVPIANVATWKEFYSAMVAAGSANFAHAQALKATLAQATTIAEVEDIVWVQQ